jgi:hypothetical protein
MYWKFLSTGPAGAKKIRLTKRLPVPDAVLIIGVPAKTLREQSGAMP